MPGKVQPDGKRIVRTIAAGPPLVVVNRHAKYVDAAAHLAMFWTSRVNSTYIVGDAVSTVHDPWRPEHFKDPEVRKAYTPAGIDAIALNMQINSPTVRVTGALEFNDLIDKNISDAWLGVVKPRQALKQIDSEWRKVIKRVGKARLKRDMVSYHQTMPKVDEPVMK